MPKVSVIIPTYNQVCFLREAIDSVLEQTFSDFEVLVVDDGSTDNTAEVIEAVSDLRVRYIRQDNQGQGGARNTGLSASKGEYIAFLDSDDRFLPDKLESQIHVLDDREEVGLVAGGWVFIDAQGKNLFERHPWVALSDLGVRTWLYGCPFAVHSVLVRRSWLEQVSGFDDDRQLRGTEDWDLWLRLAYAGCHMAWIKRVVCSYRIHSTNTIRDASNKAQGIISVLDKFFSNPDLPLELRALEDHAYAVGCLRGARRKYVVGQVESAKQDVQRAIELDPELLANDSARVRDILLAFSEHPLAGDPITYTKTVLDNLPEAAMLSSRIRRRENARGAMKMLFRAYDEHEWHTVRRAFLGAVLNDPSWLLNRGVMSIVFESVFGPRFTCYARRIFGRIVSPMGGA